MVSTSTRRFPTTSIDETVSTAFAGEATDRAASEATTGAPNMIRAASKPPRTRIPNFMRKAPLSFQCRSAPHEPTDSLLYCPACSQFHRGGKRPTALRFHFHSKTLPFGNVIKKPASRRRQMQNVVVGRKHHQHQHQTQPDPEPHLLRPLR